MLSYHSMGSVEGQADTANTIPLFQCITLNLVTFSLRQFSMQVDSSCNGGVATAHRRKLGLKSVFLLWECGMYKANDNFRVLDKVLYNTNTIFRTCTKVMYNTRTKALYFPRPVAFPLAYEFIHNYIDGAWNHTGGCLHCKLCIIIF